MRRFPSVLPRIRNPPASEPTLVVECAPSGIPLKLAYFPVASQVSSRCQSLGLGRGNVTLARVREPLSSVWGAGGAEAMLSEDGARLLLSERGGARSASDERRSVAFCRVYRDVRSVLIGYPFPPDVVRLVGDRRAIPFVLGEGCGGRDAVGNSEGVALGIDGQRLSRIEVDANAGALVVELVVRTLNYVQARIIGFAQVHVGDVIDAGRARARVPQMNAALGIADEHRFADGRRRTAEYEEAITSAARGQHAFERIQRAWCGAAGLVDLDVRVVVLADHERAREARGRRGRVAGNDALQIHRTALDHTDALGRVLDHRDFAAGELGYQLASAFDRDAFLVSCGGARQLHCRTGQEREGTGGYVDACTRGALNRHRVQRRVDVCGRETHCGVGDSATFKHEILQHKAGAGEGK